MPRLSRVLFASAFVLSSFTASAQDEEGFVPIFNGENLDGWTGAVKESGVEEGKLICGGGNLYTEKDYENFIFRFEFKTVAGGNNGVGIRTPMSGDAAYAAMEIQILDHDHPQYADIKPYQVHGSIYGVVPAKRVSLKPEGEWNTEEILAIGSHIRVTLNGEVIVDADISAAKPVDGREHPGLHNKKGRIGFLGHGYRFEMRNLQVKEFPPSE